jgi:CRP-like cAMP-binding protein
MQAAPRMASLPLAPGLDGRRALRLFALAGSRLVARGQLVFRDDHREGTVHLVASGLLMAEITAPSGRPAVVAVLRRGDLFGESALFSREWPVASPEVDAPPWNPNHIREIRALTLSRILSFPGTRLQAMLARDERMAAWVLARLVARLARTEVALARALSLPLTDRIEETLRDLAPAEGSASHVHLQVPLTQDLLAALVGATRESVNRAVRRLAREGRVSRAGPFYSVAGRSGGEDE